LLLFQEVVKAILLKMNLNSKRSKGAKEQALLCSLNYQFCYPFKKKRKLFLISPLPIVWHKFNVTIKNIYTSTSDVFSWQRNFNLFPFPKLKVDRCNFPFHKLFSSWLGTAHSFSIDVQMKPFSLFNPKGSLFSICYYKQDLH